MNTMNHEPYRWACFGCYEFVTGKTHCEYCGLDKSFSRAMGKTIVEHTSEGIKKRRYMALRIHYGA